MFIFPYGVTICTKPLSSIEVIFPSNILGCSGLVLSTLSIFAATISATLNLGCFFSCFLFVWFTMAALYFVSFSIIFCRFLGWSSSCCGCEFFHCFLPNCFLLVQIGFLCSVHLAFPCEVLFRIQLRKGRL